MRLKTLLAPAMLALASATGARAGVDPAALAGPILEYRAYVSERADELVIVVGEFAAAIKAGDLERARALYPLARVPYEQIEPIAEIIGQLDAAIDSRADDYERAELDPDFPGFHRIEFGLFREGTTAGLEPVADQLLADVTTLRDSIATLDFPPEVVVGGAAALMEEVAASKISGEENRYSGTDLWDFKANADGSRRIVELVRPLVEADDPTFFASVDGNFERVYTILEVYRDGEGYVTYAALTAADRTALAAAVNTLAEDLSTLRGKLGLD
jgi:iron uptake system component EfeO